jgi:hypothetical protein
MQMCYYEYLISTQKKSTTDNSALLFECVYFPAYAIISGIKSPFVFDSDDTRHILMQLIRYNVDTVLCILFSTKRNDSLLFTIAIQLFTSDNLENSISCALALRSMAYMMLNEIISNSKNSNCIEIYVKVIRLSFLVETMWESYELFHAEAKPRFQEINDVLNSNAVFPCKFYRRYSELLNAMYRRRILFKFDNQKSFVEKDGLQLFFRVLASALNIHGALQILLFCPFLQSNSVSRENISLCV